MRLLQLLFALTLFGSAFLSFSVQPMLGKMMLPMVGGSPSGWIVAMAFFQLALLLGYGISYALSRFTPWFHVTGLIVLYAAGLSFLPPLLMTIPNEVDSIKLSGDVLISLFKTIFMPFVALTATTAALQRVFAATKHPTAKDPYYLFVASNIGSFAGLLIYPFFAEPFSGLVMQAQWWETIYLCVMALIIVSAMMAWNNRAALVKKNKAVKRAEKPTRRDILKWLVLSFVPCSLSMGVTTSITTDLGGIPLFWVLPLALYLLTFILAFARLPYVSIKNLSFWHLIVVTFLVIAVGRGMGYQPGGNLSTMMLMGTAFLIVFFITAWMCHQMLADSRPSVDYLAQFYFVVALGGGLAGMLHAFVIPFVIPDVIEFGVVVFLSLMLNPTWKQAHKQFKPSVERMFLFCLYAAIIAIIIAISLKKSGLPYVQTAPFFLVFAWSTLMSSMRPKRLFAIACVVFAFSLLVRHDGQVVEMGRNFFGAHATYDQNIEGMKIRYFTHGNTLHGLEVLEGGKKEEKYNYGYYSRGNVIQDVLTAAQAKRFAVLGLGAGQLACYNPKMKTDFYEIDPAVVPVARDFFSYLKDCPVNKIILGDGRLMIDQSQDQYDVILMDAFSSDSIPVHLLTREAFATYRQHLNKNGILLVHISNRYFDLTKPLAALAEAEDLKAYSIIHKSDKIESPVYMSSRWVAIPLQKTAGRQLLKKGWIESQTSGAAWTDDRSSLLSALDIRLF